MRELAVNCIAVSILNAIEAPMLSFCAPQSHTATFGDQVKYCTDLVEELKMVEDAITGNQLNVLTQTIHIETRQEYGGVRRSEYFEVNTVKDLANILLKSSRHSSHGTHAEQNVLIRAGPGTGKT